MADKPVSKKPATPVTKPVAATPVVAKAAAPAVAKPAPVQPVVAKAEALKPVITPKPVAAPVAAAIPTQIVERVAPAIEEGKKAMNDTINKVQETAKKAVNETAERATAMFGDANARAKTAMEKGAKALEEIADFNKGNLEALAASGRIAAKGAEELAKYSAEYGRSAIETANANAKRFAAVKSPTEFFQLQSEVAKSSLDAMVGQASKFSESYLKLLGEMVQPLSNRYAVAAEKVKTAVAA